MWHGAQISTLEWFLQNNDPPTEADIDHLDALLHHAHNTATQQPTSQETLTAHDVITGCRSVLSVVRRLPDDVLRQIFLVAHGHGDISTPPPWWLGHICRRWRYLALALPELWANIVFTNEFRGTPLSAESRLIELLHRSSPLPFSFSLTVTDRGDQWVVYEAIARLTTESYRWKSVVIRLPQSRQCPRYDSFISQLSRVRGRLDSLEDIVYDASIDVALSPLICEALEEAPLLRSVAFSLLHHRGPGPAGSGVPRGPFQVPLRLPWEQLTSFTLDSSHDILEILQQAPNLLHYNAQIHWDGGLGPAVHHEKLTSLTLTCPPPFFERLQLPMLKSLVVCPDDPAYFFWDDSAINSLLEMIRQSSCQIESLSIPLQPSPLTNALLINVFLACPSLRHLTFTSVPLIASELTFLSMLVVDPKRPAVKGCFLPALVSFTLVTPTRNATFVGNHILDIVESRHRYRGTLLPTYSGQAYFAKLSKVKTLSPDGMLGKLKSSRHEAMLGRGIVFTSGVSIPDHPHN